MYIDEKDVYALVGERGMSMVHYSQIDALPSADVVEVVRCKDCEYFMEYTDDYAQRVEKANGDCRIRLVNCCLGGEQFCGCKYDDFCSLAKMKGGE